MRGSIRPRGKQTYQIRVEAGTDPVTGKRRQIWRTVKGGRRQAEEALAQMLLEVGQGDHLGYEATLLQLVHAWMAQTELSPTTRRDYESVIRAHISRAPIAKEKVWRIRAHMLDRFYGDLQRAGLGATRVKRVHTLLHSALRQAVRWGWITRNPAADASPPTPRRPDVIPPTPEQVRLLIENADQDFSMWLRLDASTGARRSELCALRWNRVHFDAGEIALGWAIVDGGPGVGLVEKGTKTGTVPRVALDPGTLAALRSYRKLCVERALACGVALADDAFVFSGEVDGSKPWRPDVVSHKFAALRSRLGLPRIRIHDLRHFVVTQMLTSGVDVRTVAGRVGHARASMTMDRYAAFLPAKDREAAAILGRLLER